MATHAVRTRCAAVAMAMVMLSIASHIYEGVKVVTNL
jgi:hypothetical protein